MAADGWREITVEDLKAPTENALATGPFGSSISSRYFQQHGVPVIRGSNLTEDIGTRLGDDGLVFVSEEKAAEFKRSIVRKGDLVFTCWGTINQVGLIDDRAKYNEYVISNKQMNFTPDPEKADDLFLYYLFSGPQMQEAIKNQGIGSSVPGFNLGQLRAIRLKVPPLPEQRAIAHILGTLDDKIELNRRMNETLEAMARAIFKSWFVDFDPVRAKHALSKVEGAEAHLRGAAHEGR
jgi:type I restriction enzyme S subunit